MTDATMIDLQESGEQMALEAGAWLDAIVERDNELARGMMLWMLKSPENVKVFLRVGQFFAVGEELGYFAVENPRSRDEKGWAMRTKQLVDARPELFSADHLPKDESSLRKIAELLRS